MHSDRRGKTFAHRSAREGMEVELMEWSCDSAGVATPAAAISAKRRSQSGEDYDDGASNGTETDTDTEAGDAVRIQKHAGTEDNAAWEEDWVTVTVTAVEGKMVRLHKRMASKQEAHARVRALTYGP